MRLQDRWKYLKQSANLASNILIKGRYDFTYDLMPVSAKNMSMAKRINLLKSGVNLLYRRAEAWSWPINLHVELTNYCNLRCKVCPTGIGTLKRQPQALDPYLFARLMDEIGQYLLTMSLWGWGEPLLHPQLSDILRIARKWDVTTFLSTNGQLLTDDNVIKALVDYPPTYLCVCLDGITDEVNSQFRVGAKLEPALRGVKQLIDLRNKQNSELPLIQLRFIAMKHNEHQLPDLPQFAKDNKFDVLSIRTLSVIDAPEDMHHDLVPSNETLRAYGYADEQRLQRTDFICEKAFTFPAVFADGTVVSCDQDCNAQQPYGSLANGASFSDIWWSKRAKYIRKIIRDKPELFSFCSHCPFRDRPVRDCNIKYFDLRNQ